MIRPNPCGNYNCHEINLELFCLPIVITFHRQGNACNILFSWSLASKYSISKSQSSRAISLSVLEVPQLDKSEVTDSSSDESSDSSGAIFSKRSSSLFSSSKICPKRLVFLSASYYDI